MKLRWIFFAITIVLGIAWFLRWDEVTIQKNSNQTAIHKTDRWTGQEWIELFSFDNRDEKPVISDEKIMAIKNNYVDNNNLSRLEQENSTKQSENQKLKEMLDLNKSKEEEYIKIGSKVRKEYMQTTREFYPPFSGCAEQWDEKLLSDAEEQMTKEIIDSHRVYCESEKLSNDYEKQLVFINEAIELEKKEVESNAFQLATAVLEEKAKEKREFMLRIWVCLISVSFILTLFSFALVIKKRNKGRTD